MIRSTMLLGAAALTLGLLPACDDKGGAASTTSASPAWTARSTATADATTAAATTAAPPLASATATAAAKTFDCGAKDQKPCPMQGWMKRVMAPASAGGDGEALAKALVYVADHPPPGFNDWTAIAGAGAVKAKAGDVDGAKASCKKCHDAYKDSYKASMRDRPF